MVVRIWCADLKSPLRREIPLEDRQSIGVHSKGVPFSPLTANAARFDTRVFHPTSSFTRIYIQSLQVFRVDAAT